MSEEFEEKSAAWRRAYEAGYRALLNELCEGLIRKDGRIEVTELAKRIHKVRKKLGLEKGEC